MCVVRLIAFNVHFWIFVSVFQSPAHPISKKSDESVGSPGQLKTVVLKAEFPGGSVGITLAGGTDYETKEITVSKHFLNHA